MILLYSVKFKTLKYTAIPHETFEIQTGNFPHCIISDDGT